MQREWREQAKPRHPSTRQMERIRERLRSGPRKPSEFSQCCSECRASLKRLLWVGEVYIDVRGLLRLKPHAGTNLRGGTDTPSR